MSTVVRGIKRGDVRRFDDSFNKGFKDIWASEVDTDFDTLYDALNYGISTVAPNAVGTEQLQDGAVNGAKIAADSIDSNHIINGSILELDLSSPLQDRLPPAWSPGEANRILAIDPTGNFLLWVATPPPAFPDPTTFPRVVFGKGTQFTRSAAISANTTIDDQFTHYRVNATAGPITLTLPSAVTNAGRFYIIQKADTSENPVIIARSGAEVLGASPGLTIATDRSTVQLTNPYSVALAFATNYGVDWWVMGDPPLPTTVSAVPPNNLSFSSPTETAMVTFPSLKVRGSGTSVRMAGSWGIYTTGAATGLMTLQLRVKRDTTVIHTVMYTIGTNFTHPIPVPACIDINPAPGNYIYSVTGQVVGNGVIYSRGVTAENGKLWLQES